MMWSELIQNNYGTPAIELVRGEGSRVWDLNGKSYLDMLGGIATNILGHAHPDISKAVADQVSQLGHVSNFFSHPQVLALAANLQRLTGDKSTRTFFCNSGAEANEAALKLSRTTRRKKIVSTNGSFHGRTMGALSLTGQESKRAPFKPLLSNVKFIPFGDVAAMERAITKRVAMFIVEPIQGENGVVTPPAGYLKAARKRTTETGTLLVIDAVQTGMGRTGEWFGYESEGILPDVITLAKGLGGGLPLGAMMALGKYASAFTPGSHGSTFGGNPIACAAANASINFIETNGVLAEVKNKGEYLKASLSGVPGITKVRGEGLLLGIVLETPRAQEIKRAFEDQGIIVNAPNESVIRIAPPLNIPQSELEFFVSKAQEVIGNG
jgi:acetylornithine aminotransferase